MKRLILIFLLWPCVSFAQETETIEKLLERSTESTSGSVTLELLDKFRTQKLNLNTATEKDLLALPLLTPLDAHQIILYREEHGRLNTVITLAEILGDDKYELLRHYFTVASPESSKKITGDVVARVGFESPLRYGLQAGSNPKDTLNGKAYLGSPPKTYARLRLATDNIELTGILEKDIGEKSFADFASLGLMIRYVAQAKSFSVRSVMLGDFILGFGEGLVFAPTYDISKSPEVILPAVKNLSGVSPYLSTTEQNFFRGAATELGYKDFSLVLFGSRNQFDAATDSLNGQSIFTSLNFSGYHRTATEIANEDAVTETAYGFHAAWDKAFGTVRSHVGVTSYNAAYNKSFQPTDALYNAFRFRGDHVNVSSVDATLQAERFCLFGEAATSSSGGGAYLVGILAELASGIQTVVSLRDYSKDFYSPHANAFGERAAVQNESGLYAGLAMRLSETLKLNIYYDAFHFPFISFDAVMPERGQDFLIGLSYKPERQFLFETFVQRNDFENAFTDDAGFSVRRELPVQSLRTQFDFVYFISGDVRLKTRFERKSITKIFTADKSQETGVMLYEEARVKLFDERLKADVRVSFFDTPSFDSAIYQYEDDLPLLVTSSALYGKGRRLYVNLRYAASEKVELAARFANTFKDGVTQIGTGYDAFLTNSVSTFGLGVRARF
jgi:hypothetical protein